MVRRALWNIVAIAAAALVAAACDGTPEPAPPASGPTSAPATAKATATAKAQSPAGPGEIAWDVPASWKSIPNPNSMRIATYLVARAEGDPDDAEMSVSRVGGSVEANIGRWKAQFDPVKPDSAKRFERDVAGLKVTLYEVAGSYTGMVMRGQPAKPREGWALLAAIVEGNGGDPWFFKLTGPEKTVAAARADFESLVNSFRAK